MRRLGAEEMTAAQTLNPTEARDKILSIATRLFAQQGYDSTSLSQVAREARVSKALIFWHFDSKEKLYHNALRKTLEPYFIDVGDLEGLDEAAQIERLIDLFYDFVHENVYSVRFFLSLVLRDETKPDEGLGRALELYRVFGESVASILESGRAKGVFSASIDAQRESALIVASLCGVLVQQFLSDGTSPDAKTLVDHFKVTLFQRICCAVGGPAAGRPE